MRRNKRLLYTQTSRTLPAHCCLWRDRSRDGPWSWTGQSSVQTTHQHGAAFLHTLPTTRKLAWPGLSSACCSSSECHCACRLLQPSQFGRGQKKKPGRVQQRVGHTWPLQSRSRTNSHQLKGKRIGGGWGLLLGSPAGLPQAASRGQPHDLQEH